MLDNLTLTLPQGKVTALCGLSGAGKSTVAALLERFYEPTGGRIYLDDSPLDELDPSWLRGRVLGFINQEPVLFATTIIENIRYGRPSASDQEVFVMTTAMYNYYEATHVWPQSLCWCIDVCKVPHSLIMLCVCAFYALKLMLVVKLMLLCITDGYTIFLDSRVLYLLFRRWQIQINQSDCVKCGF